MRVVNRSLSFVLVILFIAFFKITLVSSETWVLPGRLMIGVLVPIHRWLEDANDSSPTVTTVGFKFLNAILYALDTVNARENYLNYTLGVIVSDTYSNPNVALLETMKFTPAFTAQPGYANDQKNQKQGPVIAIIGPAFTESCSLSIYVTRLFKIPQVGYFAPTLLSGEVSKFPNFVRTVPSLIRTIEAVLFILQRYEWSYVNLIIDDSDDGQTAFENFMEIKISQNSAICVDTTVYLKQSPDSAEEVGIRMQQLLKATAVVNVFLSSATTSAKAIEAVLRWSDRDRNRFLWIGTNFLIEELANMRTRTAKERNEKSRNIKIPSIEHMILVVPAMINQKFMASYSINLQRDYGTTNWTYDYLMQFCSCIPAEIVSENREYDEICSKEMGELCIDRLYFDAAFYAPTVANSLFAVASALKRIQDEEYPKPISIEDMRAELLGVMKNNSYEGFSGQMYDFYQGFEGHPHFTVVSYDAQHRQWLVLAQYDSDLSPRLIFENETVLRSVRKTHPQSRCSEPCSPTQATQIDSRNPCCWSCMNCSSNQIVVPHPDEAHLFFPDIIPSTCEYCYPGGQPNANRSECVDLPLEYLKPYHPMAICFTSFGVVGLVACVLCATIYALHWNTPVIRASGREISMVMLASIFYAFANCIVIALTGGTDIGCAVASVAPGMYMAICYSAVYTRISHIERLFRLSNMRTDAPKKFISLRTQCLLMGGIIAAQAVLVGLSLYFWTPELTLMLGGSAQYPMASEEGRNKETLFVPGMPFNQLICFSTTSTTLFIGFIIPTILLLVSMVHAYKIRKVPSGFNEARALGFVSYLNFIQILLLPIMGIIVRNGLLELLPECCFLMTSAMTALFILIAPKIYIVIFRPHKNTQREVMRNINRHSQVESIELLNVMDEQNSLLAAEATEVSRIHRLLSHSFIQDIANNISHIGSRRRSASSPSHLVESSTPSPCSRMVNVRRRSSIDGVSTSPSANPPGNKQKSVSFNESKHERVKFISTSSDPNNYTFQPDRGEPSQLGIPQVNEQRLHRDGGSIVPPADLPVVNTIYLPPATPRLRQKPHFYPPSQNTHH